MRPIAALLTGAAAAMPLPAAAWAADDGRAALFGAAFAGSLDLPTALSTTRYAPGAGLVRRSTGEVARFGRADLAYRDTIRVSTTAPLPGAALLRPDAAAGMGGDPAYDVTYVRRWPSALSASKGRLSLDVTPQLGFGLSSGGARNAELGALVRMARAAGLAGEGAPRWYVYAGYHKRAMGLNLLRSEDPARRQKVDDGVARQVQAGLGARRGRFHALVGYTHEMVAMRSLGGQARDDDRVGLSLAIR